MRPTPLKKIAGYLGMESNSEEIIDEVVIDSRLSRPGTLFIPLPGTKTDGHKFVADVLNNGGCSLVSKNWLLANSWANKLIPVEDPLEALQRLAQKYLQEFEIPVVAVTGSNGKTTTKDLIGEVLKARYRIHKTAGNYNNEIGLPLTVLGLSDADQILIVEMGMRGKGEIASLAKIVQPDIAVITNIGTAHIELLKTQENIAHAKAELLEGTSKFGVAVLNGDDPWIRQIASKGPKRVIFFGLNEGNDIWAKNLEMNKDNSTSFTIVHEDKEYQARLGLAGFHNVLNALAAVGVGIGLGLEMTEIVPQLAKVSISDMRMDISEGKNGAIIIDDTYNASPASMKAAIHTAVTIGNKERRRLVAILGDMLEQGEYSQEEHQNLGKLAAENFDELIFVGSFGNEFLKGVELTDFDPNKVRLFESATELIPLVNEFVGDKDLVLLKASRGVALERVVAVLKEGCEN
ncbi:MAG: UDP-N-acetylmuramoyl-tripeptide--D-alanyl-D-alanine ligase [Firmicutes bacterium]|nr:UDP-N-acetylmuramoyl-tripeptide--D-alanyl-D-alanine ligase [Bacillota bacterium]